MERWIGVIGDENGENRTEREISYSRFGSRDYNVFCDDMRCQSFSL